MYFPLLPTNVSILWQSYVQTDFRQRSMKCREVSSTKVINHTFDRFSSLKRRTYVKSNVKERAYAMNFQRNVILY